MSFTIRRRSARGWLFHEELKTTADFGDFTDRLEIAATRFERRAIRAPQTWFLTRSWAGSMSLTPVFRPVGSPHIGVNQIGPLALPPSAR
jgi:chromosome condensin MukBEF MukE localization factor